VPIDIHAPRTGWVAMLHLSARPRRGQTLFVIAESVDWSELIP
jgi:hypothetical protein